MFEGVPLGRVSRNFLEWGSLVAFLYERRRSISHGLMPTSNRNTQSSAVSFLRLLEEFRQALFVLKLQSNTVVFERELLGKTSDRVVDLPVV